MDILRPEIYMYGLSVLLLLTILLASRGQHSPAITRWFRAQLYGMAALEVCKYIAGWDSDLYTYIYIPYSLVMLWTSGEIVWRAYREPR